MTTNDNLRGLRKDIAVYWRPSGLSAKIEKQKVLARIDAALAEPDSNDTRRVNDYDARAFALGYPNVILALAELERLKAAPDSGEVVSDSGIEQAAKYLETRAADYANDLGYEDMGALSFGGGERGQIKLDHYNGLLDLADDIRALNKAPAKAGQIQVSLPPPDCMVRGIGRSEYEQTTKAEPEILRCSGPNCPNKGEANGKDGLFYCGSGISECNR